MMHGTFAPPTVRALRAEDDVRKLAAQLMQMQDRLNLVLENITVERQGDDLNIGVRLSDGRERVRKSTASERVRYVKRIDAVLHARETWTRSG